MPKIQDTSEFELVKLHLDRFWHEIFWRRENEQKITVWTLGLFGALLALVYGQVTTLDLPQKIVLSCFPIMLGSIAAWYLHQNWVKDREIARIIVRLNESIGAWEENLLVHGDSLYPEKWKTWGQGTFAQDKVSLFYFLFVLGSSVLTIIGIMLK